MPLFWPMSAPPNRTPKRDEDGESEELSPSKASQFLLEECRTVIPGIQALFGFQLIAVINSGFGQKLTSAQQRLHLAATGLLAIAIALIMAPAAFHRQTSPRRATDEFIRVSTRLLLWSMVPLTVGLTLDFYVIASIVLESAGAVAIATGVGGVFVLLWFVLPRSRRLRRLVAR